MSHKTILENVAKSEISTTIFYGILIFLIISILWIGSFFYYKKIKTKFPSKYNSKSIKKSRLQCYLAALAITIITVCFFVFYALHNAKFIFKIHEDIKNESYTIYNGNYSIDSGISLRGAPYRKNVSVTFGDYNTAFLYTDNFFDRLTTFDGEYTGTIIYGQNSNVIVYISDDND